MQGGPHNHTIAALAVALKMAQSKEFVEYQTQVLKNCQIMSEEFKKKGYSIVSGGTDNHLILIDLKPNQIDGSRVERVCELSGIALNKNTVPGDKSALVPGGIRLGTPAITTRGFKENHIFEVVNFVHKAIEISQKVKGQTKTLKEFRDLLNSNPNGFGIKELKEEVETFCSKFETIGFSQKDMRYKD
jgi:glycine hydroxymethyltransferase